MSKPKLNQPDVETTTTTFNSENGESITINKTIPSKQFEDIFVTGTLVKPAKHQQEQDINKIKEKMIGYQYKHYKGNTYTIMDIGIHTETQELMVVYRNVNDEQIWCRPLSIFNEEIDNEHHKRFEKIDDDSDWKKQQEQEIFKEFEEQLHYKLVHITEKKLVFKNMVLNKILYIHKDRRAYESYDESSFVYEDISIKLHQLLHCLFEIWGWFDE